MKHFNLVSAVIAGAITWSAMAASAARCRKGL